MPRSAVSELAAAGPAGKALEPAFRRLLGLKTAAQYQSAPISSNVKLLLFSRAGFTDALHHVATRRDDVELVDLQRLYTGS